MSGEPNISETTPGSAENLVTNLSSEARADIGRELERVFSSGTSRVEEINGRATRFSDYQRTDVVNPVNHFEYGQAGAAAGIVTETVDRQTQKIAEGQGNLATSWKESQPAIRRQFGALLADNLAREGFTEAYDETRRATSRVGDQLRDLLPDLQGDGQAIAGSLSEGLGHLGRFNPEAPELKNQAEAIRSLKRILISLRDDYDSQRATAERFSREDREAVGGLIASLNGVLERIRGARGL